MSRLRTGRTGSPTNLYLSETIRTEAARVAAERYNMSLSEMVESLLKREMSLKKGVLKPRPALIRAV